MNHNDKLKKPSKSNNLLNNFTPQQKIKINSKLYATTQKIKYNSPKDSNESKKRKHKDLESSKEEVQSQTKFITNKIDDIYDQLNNAKYIYDLKEEFIFELKQENILDITDIFPKSLNTNGSHVLKYTKFWVLFIELKYAELDLLQIISVFNNALLYDQNNLSLIYEYLVKLISENFEKEEILIALEEINGKGNHFRVPEKIEALNNEHYKFLLDKPEIFNNFKMNILKNNNSIRNSPFSSLGKKKVDSHYSTFNLNSNKNKENSYKNDSNSAFKFIENSLIKNKENLESEINQISDASELKIVNNFNELNNKSPLESSITIDKIEDKVVNNKKDLIKLNYLELVEKNKFDLETERPVFVQILGELKLKKNKSQKELSTKDKKKKKTKENNINDDDFVSTMVDEEKEEESNIIKKKKKERGEDNQQNDDNKKDKDKEKEKKNAKNKNKKRGKSAKNKNIKESI